MAVARREVLQPSSSTIEDRERRTTCMGLGRKKQRGKGKGKRGKRSGTVGKRTKTLKKAVSKDPCRLLAALKVAGKGFRCT